MNTLGCNSNYPASLLNPGDGSATSAGVCTSALVVLCTEAGSNFVQLGCCGASQLAGHFFAICVSL